MNDNLIDHEELDKRLKREYRRGYDEGFAEGEDGQDSTYTTAFNDGFEEGKAEVEHEQRFGKAVKATILELGFDPLEDCTVRWDAAIGVLIVTQNGRTHNANTTQPL